MEFQALFLAALALVITPTQWHAAIDFPANVIDLGMMLVAELLVGLALGLGVAIFFLSFQLAGRLIGQVSGLALADFADPDYGEQTPIFGQFLFQLAMAIFIMLGGHRIVLAGLLDTFEVIALGNATLAPTVPDAIARLLTQCYSVGFRVAAPTVTAQMLASLVLGLISRTMPQLNILMVGFGFKSAVALGVLATSLGGLAWALDDQIEPLMNTWLEAIELVPAADDATLPAAANLLPPLDP